MKKALLALLLGGSLSVVAQNDIEVKMTSPSASGTITAGTAFNLDLTIKNTGNVDIDANDSIIFYPTINGSLIGTSNGGVVAYYEPGPLLPTASKNVTRQMNISGGSSGSWTFCGVGEIWGAGWTGVVESNTANNEECVTLTYDAGTVGISELRLTEAFDYSYYSNGIYYVRMDNQTIVSTPELVLYSITGKEVLRVALESNNVSIDQQVEISGLPNGVYLSEVQGVATRFVRKIVIQ